MSPENFCYWLQGYLEIGDSKDLDSNQLDIVKDHLKLVFNKVTPTYSEKFYDPMAYSRSFTNSIIHKDGLDPEFQNNIYYDGYPQVSC
jgi:hypothetical protein